MAKPKADTPDLDNEARITLGLLNVVHDNSETSQRSMAQDLGIALGLANAYLKRCVKKGLIKVSQAPANRYVYYLTPQGFAEKSRLTAEYLSESFNLFRRARAESADLFEKCRLRGWSRVALYGVGDLTDIVTLTARDFPIELVGIVDSDFGQSQFSGLPVVPDVSKLETIDAVMICDIAQPQASYDKARASFPSERVLAPRFLHLSTATPSDPADNAEEQR